MGRIRRAVAPQLTLRDLTWLLTITSIAVAWTTDIYRHAQASDAVIRKRWDPEHVDGLWQSSIIYRLAEFCYREELVMSLVFIAMMAGIDAILIDSHCHILARVVELVLLSPAILLAIVLVCYRLMWGFP